MKYFRYLCALVLGFVIFVKCSDNSIQVDLLVKNAHILNSDGEFIGDFLAINKGKFEYVGVFDKHSEKYTADSVIDCSGNYIYAGFHDGHCHFYGLGKNIIAYAELGNCSSFKEVINIVKKHGSDVQSGWILGRGWDQNNWKDKKFPTKHMLDSIFPERPVMLTRVDGHAVLANAKALKLSGIDSTSSIEGGEIEIRNGKLTGILLDVAADSIKATAEVESSEFVERALLAAQDTCFKYGLVCVTDAGLDYSHIDIIDSLQEVGKLKIKINAMINPEEKNYKRYLYNGGVDKQKLRVKTIKLYADGALGSRGAKLTNPYSDDSLSTGILTISPEDIDNACKLAYDHNFQVACHAIGDSANRFVLNHYSKYLKDTNDRRWRIEHAQIVDPNDYAMFQDYSIIPSMQTCHATSDMEWAETRLGHRIDWAYQTNKLLGFHKWFINGTDCPVESINPMYNIYAAITRKSLKPSVEWKIGEDQAIDISTAIKSLTEWPAKGAFWENKTGRIEKGMDADFIVFKKNLFDLSPEQMIKITPEETWIDGEMVYSK
ncbi:MAG: amidohydrolase [Marinilabiliales bacterium]|nr:MAG: amidohydrolase [Marinilabiliales bacterium]